MPSSVPIGFNGTGQPPAVKALDCFPGADDLVVGTDKCDIYKIKLVAKPDGTYEPAVPTLLVKGHTADVNAIDLDGDNALQIADRRGYVAIADLLKLQAREWWRDLAMELTIIHEYPPWRLENDEAPSSQAGLSA